MQDQQVSGVTEPTNLNEGGSPLRPKRRRFVVIAVIIVVVVVVALVLWLLFVHGKGDQKSADATVCSSDIISKASPAIRDHDINTLESVTSTILKKQGYKQDVNCNYILEQYYIMTADVDKAQSTLSDLKIAYDKSSGYSTQFDPPAVSVSALQQSLDVVRDNQAQSQQVLSNDPNRGVQ